MRSPAVDKRPTVVTKRHGTTITLTVATQQSEAALKVIARMVHATLLSDAGFALAKDIQTDELLDASRRTSEFMRPIEAEVMFGEGHHWAFA